MKRIVPAAAGNRGRALMVGIVVSALTVSASAQAAPASETAPGTSVEELLALVRTFNPDLAAAALESEAAVAKILPAGALDDPTLNVARDQGFRQTTASVSQDFPLWGKRELRKGVAEENAKAARGREAGVGKELDEQIKITFAQYYEVDHAIRVTHEIHSLLHSVAGSARARYGQGLGSQSDAIRADLETTRLDTDVYRLEREEETAKAKINALIAHRADAALAEPLVLRKVPSVASLALDDLMARARDRNPMLAAARAEISAAEGERTLVDKSYYPDITVSVGTDALPNQSPQPMVGLGIKIPFQWGVREAQAHAATAKKGAAQLRLDGEMLKLGSELRSTLASLREAERTRSLLKNGLSQQSDAAYRSALATYQQGHGDLTPVLEAAHRQLEIRIELLRVETEEQTALAAIERLVGEDL